MDDFAPLRAPLPEGHRLELHVTAAGEFVSVTIVRILPDNSAEAHSRTFDDLSVWQAATTMLAAESRGRG